MKTYEERQAELAAIYEDGGRFLIERNPWRASKIFRAYCPECCRIFYGLEANPEDRRHRCGTEQKEVTA
ncbi:MAG: hypothetical protein IK099_10380 [Clostridia bacterium]|nr:hypothetical protein [Clostridia bacterium]